MIMETVGEKSILKSRLGAAGWWMTSATWARATSGRRPRPWPWWRRSARSTAWQALSGATASAPCRPERMGAVVPAGTGASRTACTGLWMSPTAEDHARTREGNSAENFSILFPTGHAWSGMAVACLAYRKSAILMGNFGSCWLGCSQFFTHSYWRQLTRVAFHQGIPS